MRRRKSALAAFVLADGAACNPDTLDFLAA